MLYPFLSLKEHVMDRRLVSLVSMTVLLGVCSLVGAVDIPAIPAPITVNDPHVDPLDAQAPSFDFADDLVIQQMLSTWNTPDHHGMSCVECHGSPNAAEFFLVGIDQGDVVRRGLPHHPQDKVDDLLAGLARLREIYGLQDLDRDRDRVFILQPGPVDPSAGTAQPLAGEHYWDRDAAFMLEEVPRVTPTLTTNISTLDEVRQAIDELLATENAGTFRAPFRSSMYSSDSFHATERGEPTGNLNKWIALFPQQPRSDAWAAEILRLRNIYMAQPSNLNFYNWYRAEDLGAGSFGSMTTNESHVSAEGIDHFTLMFEKRKRQAAMIGFHQMLQEALGMSNTLRDKGMYMLEHLGQDPQYGRWKAFNPMHGLGDDTGRPSAVRSDRLKYPEFLGDRFAADFLLLQSNAGRRDIDEFITRKAAREANNWWLLGLTYDPGRRAPGMGGGYWALHMQTTFGKTARVVREGIAREDALPGYAGYSSWAFLRGTVLNLSRREKYGETTVTFPAYAMTTIDGLNNAYGHANEAHRQALLRLGLNSMKIRMAWWTLTLERELAAGRTPQSNNFGVRAQNQYIFGKVMAQELPDAEEQLETLAYFYQQWEEAAHRLQAGTATPPERVAGYGDGLIATYYDKPDFTLPLRSENIPMVWISDQATYGVASTNTGTVLSVGTEDHVKGINGTDSNANASPVPMGSEPGHAVQWTGYVQAPTTGDYTFWLHDIKSAHLRTVSASVIVDGVVVSPRVASDGRHFGELNNYGLQGIYMGIYQLERVRLEAGEKYPITVQYSNSEDGRFIAQLLWHAPGVQWAQIVPQRYLYTAEDAHLEQPVDDQLVEIPPQTLPDMYTDVAYIYQVQLRGGNPPFQLRHTDGALPPGLRFTNGLIHGTTDMTYRQGNSDAQRFSFSVTVTDNDGDAHARELFIRLGPDRDAPPVAGVGTRSVILDNAVDHLWLLPGQGVDLQLGAESNFPGMSDADRTVFAPVEQANDLLVGQ